MKMIRLKRMRRNKRYNYSFIIAGYNYSRCRLCNTLWFTFSIVFLTSVSQATIAQRRRHLEHEASERQRNLKKRGQYFEKKEEMTRKIRDLGSLPQDAFERYSGKDIQEVFKRIVYMV